MDYKSLVTIDKKDFKYFISRLYDEYFEDYIYEVLGDEDNEKLYKMRLSAGRQRSFLQ